MSCRIIIITNLLILNAQNISRVINIGRTLTPFDGCIRCKTRGRLAARSRIQTHRNCRHQWAPASDSSRSLTMKPIGAFIHVSSFADVVWNGLSTKHVRESLEPSIDLQQLRFLWSPISPYPFIKRLRGTRREILALSGRYDTTFLPELSQQAYDEFDRCSIPHQRVWLPCGHYTMGKFPFNAMAGYQVVRFLISSGQTTEMR